MKKDIHELYKVFNFTYYERPLSRISRLTGISQKRIEDELGVCQLSEDIGTSDQYFKFLFEYDEFVESNKLYRGTSKLDEFIRGH